MFSNQTLLLGMYTKSQYLEKNVGEMYMQYHGEQQRGSDNSKKKVFDQWLSVPRFLKIYKERKLGFFFLSF